MGKTGVGNNRQSSLQTISLGRGEQKALDIQYAPTTTGHAENGRLKIVVIDEQGHPLATPLARLEQDGNTIDPMFNTDDGKTFRAMTGKAQLHVEYPGFQPTQEIVDIKPTKKVGRLPHVVILKQP